MLKDTGFPLYSRIFKCVRMHVARVPEVISCRVGFKSAWEGELAPQWGWPARMLAELTRVGVAVKLTVFGQTVLELLTHAGLASGRKSCRDEKPCPAAAASPGWCLLDPKDPGPGCQPH